MDYFSFRVVSTLINNIDVEHVLEKREYQVLNMAENEEKYLISPSFLFSENKSLFDQFWNKH